MAAEFRRLIGADADDRDRLIGDAHALDNRLHDLIAESCGNAFLLEELNRLKLLSRAFRDYAYEQGGPLGISLLEEVEAREHLAIVEALIARDRRAAVRAMSRHIVSGIRDVREISRFASAEIAPESRHSSHHPATDGHASADGRSRGPG